MERVNDHPSFRVMEQSGIGSQTEQMATGYALQDMFVGQQQQHLSPSVCDVSQQQQHLSLSFCDVSQCNSVASTVAPTAFVPCYPQQLMSQRSEQSLYFYVTPSNTLPAPANSIIFPYNHVTTGSALPGFENVNTSGSSKVAVNGTLIPDRVFVGGIPTGTKEEELFEFFGTFGVVKECKIMKDPFNGKSKGYGFVTFNNDEVAKNIIEQNNSKTAFEFKTRRLNIAPAFRKGQNVANNGVNNGPAGNVPPFVYVNGQPCLYSNGFAYPIVQDQRNSSIGAQVPVQQQQLPLVFQQGSSLYVSAAVMTPQMLYQGQSQPMLAAGAGGVIPNSFYSQQMPNFQIQQQVPTNAVSTVPLKPTDSVNYHQPDMCQGCAAGVHNSPLAVSSYGIKMNGETPAGPTVVDVWSEHSPEAANGSAGQGSGVVSAIDLLPPNPVIDGHITTTQQHKSKPSLNAQHTAGTTTGTVTASSYPQQALSTATSYMVQAPATAAPPVQGFESQSNPVYPEHTFLQYQEQQLNSDQGNFFHVQTDGDLYQNHTGSFGVNGAAAAYQYCAFPPIFNTSVPVSQQLEYPPHEMRKSLMSVDGQLYASLNNHNNHVASFNNHNHNNDHNVCTSSNSVSPNSKSSGSTSSELSSTSGKPGFKQQHQQQSQQQNERKIKVQHANRTHRRKEICTEQKKLQQQNGHSVNINTVEMQQWCANASVHSCGNSLLTSPLDFTSHSTEASYAATVASQFNQMSLTGMHHNGVKSSNGFVNGTATNVHSMLTPPNTPIGVMQFK